PSELLADQMDQAENHIEESGQIEELPSEYISNSSVSSPDENLWDQDTESDLAPSSGLNDQASQLANGNTLAEELPMESTTDKAATDTDGLDQELEPEPEITTNALLADRQDQVENPVEASNEIEELPAEYISDGSASSPEENLWDQDAQLQTASSQEPMGDQQNEIVNSFEDPYSNEALLTDQMDPTNDTATESEVGEELVSEATTPNKMAGSSGARSAAIPIEAISSETMEGLDDTRVTVYSDGTEQPARYEDGILTFDAAPDKDYNMIISNPGYRDVAIEIPEQAIEQANPDELIVSLEEAAISEASGDVASRFGGQNVEEKELILVDPEGDPLPNATAQLFVDGEKEATLVADEKGALIVPVFEDRDHSILINQPNVPNQIVEINPMSWDDTHTEVVSGVVPSSEIKTLADLKESGQWQNAEIVMIEDLRGENQTYLSTNEQLYEVVNEGEDAYLVQDNQKILLSDSDQTSGNDIKEEAETFYKGLPDEEKLYVDQVINQKLDITSPDDLPSEAVEDYYTNLSFDDQAKVDQLISKKAKALGIGDPIASLSNGQNNTDPLLKKLVGENGYAASEAITINNIYYDFDKSTIRKDAAVELDKLVDLLSQHKELKLAMGSHTDVRGSSSYNEALSKRRAQAAVDYLLAKGISADRLSTDSYGESMPVNGCNDGKSCNESQHQLNRRTEFRLVQG
ncbi:MAG: OmpA family protein, partial [Cyclobacteriaceae bacterium]